MSQVGQGYHNEIHNNNLHGLIEDLWTDRETT